MSEENELPEGWCWTLLKDCSHRITDGTHQPPKFVESGIPFIFVSHIVKGTISFENTRYISETTYKELNTRCPVELGDILYTAVGSYGVAVPVLTDLPFSFQRHIAHIKPYKYLSMKYLTFCLNSLICRNQAHIVARGVAQKTVTLTDLARFVLPIAPVAEQHRIVTAIELQFTRLDAAVAALQHTKAKLKRYRASVLKAAVEGKLTEAWRAEHHATEPASVLLKRILVERRAKWEADLRAKGKDPAKAKYVEPAIPDLEKLPEVPEGWCWATVEQLSTKVVDGVHKKPNYVSTGIPFVTVRNLTAGPNISFEKLNYITIEDHIEFSKRANPEKGDILISKDGTLGVIRVINTEVQFSIFVSVAVIKPVKRDMGNYLGLALSSPQVQVQMVPKGTGLQHIHLEDLREDCIPLSPVAEQEQIVAEVERSLSIITILEATVEANLKRAERLRQSILKEAFAGRLVPQDPNDEPASVLLERIHKEREGQKQGLIKKPRSIKTISAPRMPDVEPMQIDASEMEQMDLWAGIGNGG